MAERGQAKYYPPEWRPEHGSLNRFHGQHPLRSRVKPRGALTVRFEMPFNAWCLACERHIGLGVRFNATKSRNGEYLSTPIYDFAMKCPSCPNNLRIRTDPRRAAFVCVEGVRRKIETPDADEEGGEAAGKAQAGGEAASQRAAAAARDPMARLEVQVEEKVRTSAEEELLTRVTNVQETMYADALGSSQAVRSLFRSQKRRAQNMDRIARSNVLGVPLVSTTLEDEMLIAATAFGRKGRPAVVRARHRSASTGIFGSAHSRAIARAIERRRQLGWAPKARPNER